MVAGVRVWGQPQEDLAGSRPGPEPKIDCLQFGFSEQLPLLLAFHHAHVDS